MAANFFVANFFVAKFFVAKFSVAKFFVARFFVAKFVIAKFFAARFQNVQSDNVNLPGEAHALLPHASWVADITTFNKRNSGEAVLIPGMLVDHLMVVLHALTATEGFRPRDGGDVRRHTSCGLAKDLDTLASCDKGPTFFLR